MNVARTTVQAIYDSAREKLARMLAEGRPLTVQGGTYDPVSYTHLDVYKRQYKGSLQGSPSQTHSFLGSAAGCPSPLQGDPLLLFPKNSSKTRAGPKRKRAKGPFFLRLSKKRLCHFFEKAAACRARDWSAASGQTPHLQPEKCFPRRTCRRRKQITTGFAPAGANSARLFPLSLFLLLLGLKALKSL